MSRAKQTEGEEAVMRRDWERSIYERCDREDAERADAQTPECIVGEHLWFAGPKGPYCGKCKVPKP